MTAETNFYTKHTDGDVHIITLTNSHNIKISILNYGGILHKIIVPDKTGKHCFGL